MKEHIEAMEKCEEEVLREWARYSGQWMHEVVYVPIGNAYLAENGFPTKKEPKVRP